VDDAEGSESETVGFGEVFLDDGLDVARGDGVEVEDVGDGDADWLVVEFHGERTETKKPGPATGTGLLDYLIART
jgi:hypothetical protein